MKKNSFLLYSFLLLAAACSKSDKSAAPSPSSGAGISAAVSTQLTKTDSLGDYAKFFGTVTLTDAETSGGVTVLAPSNNAFGNATVSPAAQLPDGSTANDYILKGILKASDFVNNKTVTTLSGKTLTVSVVADPIVLVGGMIINTNAISGTDNYVIYSAAQLLNAPAPVFVTVWDATKWSSNNPKGLPAAKAAVALFASQTATTPTYSGTAGADGVAMINGVQPGTYYVAATAATGSANSLFSPYSESSNGFIGYAADTVIDNTGKVVYQDINKDGKVDMHDLVTVPYQTIQAAKNQPVNAVVMIGQIYPTIANYAAAQIMLNAVYSGLTTTYQDLVLMDGVLSDDQTTDFGSQPNWFPFENFTMVSSSSILSAIWNDAYFNNLNKVNYLIRDINGLPDATSDQKTEMMAEAMVLREFIYLELTTYFGDIPTTTDLGSDFYPYISRTPATTVRQDIVSVLNSQAANLPATRTDGGVTKYAALALAVKAAQLLGDYNTVSSNCQTIKSSGLFTLTLDHSSFTWLTAQSTTETIWAPAFSKLLAANNWFYSDLESSVNIQWIPVQIYSRILLSDADAQMRLNNVIQATADINLLRARDQVAPYTVVTDSIIQQRVWEYTMYRQGDRYPNLIRWGLTQSVLAPYYPNYNSNKNLMPIPQVFLNNYIDIVQNPGY